MTGHKLFLPILDNGLGMCRVGFVDSFIKAFSGHQLHFDFISDSHPGRGRNRAVANFLATDCTHLLFIDGDIHFTAQHIALLEASDEPVLAGIYCLKGKEVRPCLQTLPGFQPTAVGGLLEVRRTGTGFLRIAREVFEALKATSPHYTNHKRDEWDFFQSGVVNGEWLSEDWYFCEKARDAGFRVMVDTRIQLGHEGTAVYPLKETPEHLDLCPADMKEHIDRLFKGEYAVPLDPPPRTILDLGANIGGFTVWAKEQWPEAHVLAYEPHPFNAALFRHNTRAWSGVDFQPMGVRRQGGMGKLVEGGNCGEYSFHFDPLNGNVIEVLNEHARHLPPVELIKLDVEGCELEILMDLDLTQARAIVLEYHSQSDREAITKLLVECGFTLHAQERVDHQRGILKFLSAPAPDPTP